MSPAGRSAAFDSFNEIATVRIALRDSDPVIWRQVEVPTSITLKALHNVIQAVMGWFDYHLWSGSSPSPSADTACRWTRTGAPNREPTPARFACGRC
jgi:hypothetical protein